MFRPPSFRKGGLMETAQLIMEATAFLFGSLVLTVILNKAMQKHGFKVKTAVNITVISILTCMLLFVGGASIWTAKGIIFAGILLCASVQDISTREADDSLWIMLLILSMVNFSPERISSMFAGGLTVFVPQLAVAVFGKSGSIGGADIKLSTAAAVVCGFSGGVIGYAAGLLFAVVFQSITNKIKKRTNKEPLALLPFLSAGLMLGYFI